MRALACYRYISHDQSEIGLAIWNLDGAHRKWNMRHSFLSDSHRTNGKTNGRVLVFFFFFRKMVIYQKGKKSVLTVSKSNCYPHKPIGRVHVGFSNSLIFRNVGRDPRLAIATHHQIVLFPPSSNFFFICSRDLPASSYFFNYESECENTWIFVCKSFKI